MELDIGHKVENEGKNSQGRLSAKEFNRLIDFVVALDKFVNGGDGEISINDRLASISKKIEQTIISIKVADDGFHFMDGTGKDVMNYTESGFDIAKASEHLISLILSSGVITAEMLSDELKSSISTLQLGETSDTAYAGDKGKSNADSIVKLEASLISLAKLLEVVSFMQKVKESGFHVADSTGKDVMNYTESGFDVAKITTHFLSLVLSSGVITEDMLSEEVKSMIVTLGLGETSDTAYAGDKGKANADSILKLESMVKSLVALAELISFMSKVNEEGFHLADSTGMDILNYTSSGFDVAKVTDHFISLILSDNTITESMLSKEVKEVIRLLKPLINLSGNILNVIQDGFHFSDSTGKDVMNYTEAGFDVAKVSESFISMLKRQGIGADYVFYSTTNINF